MASGCNNPMCVCGAAGVPWACKCSCRRCAWEREVAVNPAMSFRDKQEELGLLGGLYKWFFQEGYAAKMALAAPLDLRRTHDLVLERARRITQSMTTAEREIALLLSPQPRPSHVVPGTTAMRSRVNLLDDFDMSSKKPKPPRGEPA